ncbi:hypothetical protein EDM27_17350, partial [Staphylococcus aureus]
AGMPTVCSETCTGRMRYLGVLLYDADRVHEAASFPRIEAGMPTVCSETCTGRMRYLGVLLYDADRVHEAAS